MSSQTRLLSWSWHSRKSIVSLYQPNNHPLLPLQPPSHPSYYYLPHCRSLLLLVYQITRVESASALRGGASSHRRNQLRQLIINPPAMGTKRPLPKADGGEPAPIPKRFRGTAKGSKEAPFTSIVPLSLGKSKTTIKPQGAALHIYKTPEAPLVSDGSVASNEITPSRPDEELISSLREYIDGHPALDAVYKTSVSPLIAPAALPNEDDQDAQPEDDGDKVISGTNFHTNLDLDSSSHVRPRCRLR